MSKPGPAIKCTACLARRIPAMVIREPFPLSTLPCRRIPTIPACRCPWTKSMHNVVRAMNIRINSFTSWALPRSMNSCPPVKSGTMCKPPRPRPVRHPRHLPVDDDNNNENNNWVRLPGILGTDGAAVPVSVHRRICPRIRPRIFCRARAVEGAMIPKMIRRFPPNETRRFPPNATRRLPPNETRSHRPTRNRPSPPLTPRL